VLGLLVVPLGVISHWGRSEKPASVRLEGHGKYFGMGPFSGRPDTAALIIHCTFCTPSRPDLIVC
jgi:hypothetical protein